VDLGLLLEEDPAEAGRFLLRLAAGEHAVGRE
jgi:hypothetical protein